MIARISTVFGCVLFAVWLAKEPGWEPLSAFVLAALSYAGAEFAQRSKEAKNRQHLDVVSLQRDEALGRESALREEGQRKQEVIEEFHRRDEMARQVVLDDVKATCQEIAKRNQK